MIGFKLMSISALGGVPQISKATFNAETNKLRHSEGHVASRKNTLEGPASTPLVSVGMPVKNGAKSITKALQSLSSQSYQNIEIVVCDNASADETCSIVEKAAQKDPRIVLKKFEVGVCIQQSYRRALDSRRGTYFMFAPCDDSWHPNFIEHAVHHLESDPESAVCCGDITLVSESGTVLMSEGVVPIGGSVKHRWTTALITSFDASRLYGLLRNRNLDRLFPDENPEGWDHYSAAKLALNGKFCKIDVPAMTRHQTPPQAYWRLICAQESTLWGRVFYGRHIVRLFRNDPDFDTKGLKANLALWHFVMLRASAPQSPALRFFCAPLRGVADFLALLHRHIK